MSYKFEFEDMDFELEIYKGAIHGLEFDDEGNITNIYTDLIPKELYRIPNLPLFYNIINSLGIIYEDDIQFINEIFSFVTAFFKQVGTIMYEQSLNKSNFDDSMYQ